MIDYRINDDKSLTFFLTGDGHDQDFRDDMTERMETGTKWAEYHMISEYFHERLEIVDPEDNMDLTDGLIFTDGEYDWWDSDYAITSLLDTLLEEGEVIIPYARPHRYVFDDETSGYDAVDFLNNQPHYFGCYAVQAKYHELPQTTAFWTDISNVPHYNDFYVATDDEPSLFISNIERKEIEYENDWTQEALQRISAIHKLAQKVSDFEYNLRCVKDGITIRSY